MTATLAAERTSTRGQRLAVVASGAALLGAAAYTALNDPSAPSAHFPGCAFHAITGLWCPGCGLTRGVHALLGGHPLAAIGHNVFTPLVVLTIAWAWGTWSITTFSGRPRPTRHLARHLSPRVSMGVSIAVVAYGVLRNIPFAPFRSLAP